MALGFFPFGGAPIAAQPLTGPGQNPTGVSSSGGAGTLGASVALALSGVSAIGRAGSLAGAGQQPANFNFTQAGYTPAAPHAVDKSTARPSARPRDPRVAGAHARRAHRSLTIREEASVC